MDKRAKDKLVRAIRQNGEGQDAQKDLHSRTGKDEKKEEDPGKDGKRKQKEIVKCWE